MFTSTAMRTIAPRGARFLTTAARQPQVSAPAAQQSAKITTTAASISNPGPSASSQSHVVSWDGVLKSSNRHFHANGSESSAGLSQSFNPDSARHVARMNRMREAKELAGLL